MSNFVRRVSLLFTVLTLLLLSGCDNGAYDLTNNQAVAIGAASVDKECVDQNPLRNAYFGDLHVHTTNSSDAYNFSVNLTPQDAYDYAFGAEVLLPPNDENGKGTRPVRIDRPLDFAGVTDHAEFLGENRLCKDTESSVYDSDFCVDTRKAFGRDYRLAARIFSPRPWRSDPPCGEGSELCKEASATVWREIIQAAEDWNDSSLACERTAFVAYEYSSFRNGSNLHRNVIFRNGIVPPMPVSYVEADRAWKLWEALDHDCNQSDTGCEAFSIPHNSNISNGRMFAVDYPDTDGIDEERKRAALRVRIEPLVEIMQHKGDSECRNGLSNVLGGDDELCDYEKFEAMAFQRVAENSVPDDCYEGIFADSLPHAGPNCLSKLSYVRYALVEGLKEETRMGVNPYKFGLSASTDTHNALAGGVQERDFAGHLGMGDEVAEKRAAWDGEIEGNTSNGPGGIIGVWAKQNTRDDLFDAMLNKEVFGTSGPRILPRFFAGRDYPKNLCDDPELLTKAYRDGVPMGGDVPALSTEGVSTKHVAAGQAPVFLAMASADVGTADFPGTALQRLQIIKGWSDSDGNTHQQIFDVAGNASNGASVDVNSCQQSGEGHAQLCAVWQDPEFDPAISAVYYLRAVENPSCRYNGWQCLTIDEAKRPEACSGNNPLVKLVQQERAWTSPIWYSAN